jgi:hypothetical protein
MLINFSLVHFASIYSKPKALPGLLIVRQKKAEEDATFYFLIKDGTFFPLFFWLTNPTLLVSAQVSGRTWTTC